MKSIAGIFTMLSVMMETETKILTNISFFFSEIIVAKHGVCRHAPGKKIKKKQ